jgi:hypothetical protein
VGTKLSDSRNSGACFPGMGSRRVVQYCCKHSVPNLQVVGVLGPDFPHRPPGSQFSGSASSLTQRANSASSMGSQLFSCTEFMKCSSVVLLCVQLRVTKPVNGRGVPGLISCMGFREFILWCCFWGNELVGLHLLLPVEHPELGVLLVQG